MAGPESRHRAIQLRDRTMVSCHVSFAVATSNRQRDAVFLNERIWNLDAGDLSAAIDTARKQLGAATVSDCL